MALYASRHCAHDFIPWKQAYEVLPIKKSNDEEVLVNLTLDGHPLEAMLDTGAVATVLTSKGARAIGLPNETIRNGSSYKMITPDGHNPEAHALTFEMLKLGEQMWTKPTIIVQTYSEKHALENWNPNFRGGVSADLLQEAVEELNPSIVLGLDFLEHYKIWIFDRDQTGLHHAEHARHRSGLTKQST